MTKVHSARLSGWRALPLAVGGPVWNSAVYTAGNLAPQITNVLLLPIMTRFLSREEYGIFGYTTAICTFLGVVGNLSIHSYALRHYFECRTDDDRRRLFGGLFWFLAGYALMLLALELWAMPRIFRFFHVSVPFEPYMRLALYSVAIETLAIIPLTYFRVREEAGRFMALSLTLFALNMGLSLYLVIGLRAGVIGRYYGQLGANLIMLAVYLAIVLRVTRFAWDPSLMKRALIFSFPIALSGLLAMVSNMSDRVVLERYVPLTQLGIYTVGFSIAYGLNSLSNGIYKAIEPVVYRMAAQAAFEVRIVTVKRYLVALLTLVGCFAIAFSREAVTLLATSEFRESYKIVALVSARAVLIGFSMPLAVFVVAIKRTGYVARVETMGAVISLLANLTLIPRLGIIGAGISGVLAALVVVTSYVVLTERASAVRWGYFTDLMLTACAFGGAAAILQVQTTSIITTMLVKLPLTLFVAGLWYFVQPNGLRRQALRIA